MNIEELIDNFAYLDDWEERYRYIIDLGRQLPDFPSEEKTDANKVQGCVSQVWLIADARSGSEGDPVIHFRADSDAHIVRGLIAILLFIFSDKTARQILDIDIKSILSRLGLEDHLSPSRTNGLHAMIGRMRQHAHTIDAAG